MKIKIKKGQLGLGRVPAVLSYYDGQLDDCAYLLPTIAGRGPGARGIGVRPASERRVTVEDRGCADYGTGMTD